MARAATRSTSTRGGANGVNGLNAFDSGTLSTNGAGDIEPSDQGLCAGNGFVVESNNIGEILVFNQNLHRVSSVISLDTLMGLTGLGYSSGGDISCAYDSSNGGHWFFTEIVSESPESAGGPFAGCFVGVPGTCYEGIAVTKGSNPFGPYNVYFLNANYNPAEPGAPYLLNDFAKIATSRTRSCSSTTSSRSRAARRRRLQRRPGVRVQQERARARAAGDAAQRVAEPALQRRHREHGQHRDARRSRAATGGPCWYSVIPTEPPDASQFDNSHGGSGFMLATLDFYGAGDTRVAAFDWTGLGNLNSPGCFSCGGIQLRRPALLAASSPTSARARAVWGVAEDRTDPAG